jgi:hypothetical protein
VGPGVVCFLHGPKIAHLGYLTETDRVGRFHRNSPLMQADMTKHEDRILNKALLIRDYWIEATARYKANGSQLDERGRFLCEQIIALYEKHFLDERLLWKIDPSTHYSDACVMLGIGVDAVIDIRTARCGVGDPVEGGRRYLSINHLQREAARILKTKVQQIEGELW